MDYSVADTFRNIPTRHRGKVNSNQSVNLNAFAAMGTTMPRVTRPLVIEEFETRLCLSSVSFVSHAITDSADWVFSVYAADVDGDGDADVLSASYNDDTIAWYENTDGRGTFGQPHVITTRADGAFLVQAIDVDGDGDMDVLAGSRRSDEVAWYENMDGKGMFSDQRVIMTTRALAWVHAGDVDSDGDTDVFTVSVDGIAWHENVDGRGSFSESKIIPRTGFDLTLDVADIDGDGDMDAVAPSLSKVLWYENTDGMGRFSSRNVSSDDAIASVHVADVDGDGDSDVLVGGGKVVGWWENTDGKGSFGQRRVITTAASQVYSVYAADVDGDGDTDVLSASRSDGKFAWYENTDGRGRFGVQSVIAEANGATSIHVADVDGDGDMDVLSAARGDNRIAWHENLSPRIAAGDANGDLQFDQQDIVQVLQSAKYLTDEPATFEEGDWNGDGVFDQLDIVAALQIGHYLQGSYVDIVSGKAQ